MWHLSGKNVLQWVILEKIHTSLTEEVSAIQGGEEEKCLKMSKEKGRYAHASLSKGQVCPILLYEADLNMAYQRQLKL